MKIVIFGALVLFLMTEVCADLSNQRSKIQSPLKKLFNLKPDRNIAHRLGKPMKLNTEEKSMSIESHEFSNIQYRLNNVTIAKFYIDDQRPKLQYISLTCDFHQQLEISQAIDPPGLEIKGLYEYELKNSPESPKPAEQFIIKQYDGRLIYKIMSNDTTNTELVYKDEQFKYGESKKDIVAFIRAIALIIPDVNNKTANQLNQDSNLAQKIKDFEHIFPFLPTSLHPMNTTASRSQDENIYIINNTKIERWGNIYWIPSRVVIRELNNFKRAKIIVYDDAERVHFNLTLSTNKLTGYFEWSYGLDENILISGVSQNFTIGNLTITVNTIFDKDLFVDKVEVDLGSIILQKSNVSEVYPDINDVVYNIFHENLQKTIKTQLKQLIHEEYSQQEKSDALGTTTNDVKITPTSGLVNSTNQTITTGRLTIDLLNRTTILSISMSINTSCKDDRRWWQKIYRRNKCEQSENPTTQQVFVDKRSWFQKLFVNNKRAKNVSSENTSTTQPMQEIEFCSDMQQDEMKKSVDTRWWFQKLFIRNKCLPEKSM